MSKEWCTMQKSPRYNGGVEREEFTYYAQDGFDEYILTTHLGKDILLCSGEFTLKEGYEYNFDGDMDCFENKNSIVDKGVIQSIQSDSEVSSETCQVLTRIGTLKNYHYIVYEGEIWLIASQPRSNDVYEKTVLKICNNVLKFQDKLGNIHYYPYWCEEASSYGNGENTSKTMTVISDQFNISLPLDDSIRELYQNKRFSLFKVNSIPRCYELTGIDFASGLYKDIKIAKLGLTACEYDPNKDRTDLMLCDYFEPNTDTPTNNPTITGSCEISYKSNPTIKCGGNAKKFNCVFKDDSGNIIVFPNDIKVKWTIESTFEENKLNIVKQDDYITFKVTDESLIDDMFKLTLSDEDGIYGGYSLTVDISSIY